MTNLESYTKTTWENGQVITAAPLNKIEQRLEDVTNAVLGMATTISSNDLKATKITAREIAGVSSNDSTAANITIGENTTLNLQGPVQANGKISLGYTIDEDTDAASKKYIDDAIAGVRTTIAGYKVKSIGVTDGLTATTTKGTATISLSAATTDTLGGIKVGANLDIDNDGKLNATDTTYSEATESAAGLMSAADKVKLKNIATGATSNKGTVTGIILNGNNDITYTPNAEGIISVPAITGLKVNNNFLNIESGKVDFGTIITAPTLPLSNGTYTLQLTLTDGTPTYQWVAIGGE